MYVVKIFAPAPLCALVSKVAQVVVIVGEAVGKGEVGQYRLVVDRVGGHLVKYLQGVCQRFGQVGKYFVHLRLRLHPLLFSIAHSCLVSEVLVSADADKTVMRLGVGLVDEMHVICRYNLYIIFACDSY